ncbi:hypothetical protein BLS_009911 [Venturia inaequalis]|uniref:BHLH domain-containing protein n=1 Tax=Venturia inaequalis TaxID=5025 RepID=A0A8H3U635_VENIN|nr:hypothetical protein BLS_009911 [Venturia inaequalis]
MDSSRPGTAYTTHHSLPPITALTSDLPPPEPSPGFARQSLDPRDVRDSGNWSQQSKHSSTVSNTAGLQLQTILNHDDSPSRMSMHETAHSARNGHHSLPTITHGVVSYDQQQRGSLDAHSILDSRRGSVDSRMNMGMGHLAISPSSPYDSQNVSRVSLASNLQQQRGIIDQRTNGIPVSPVGSRASLRSNTQPRRAPVIPANPRAVSGMPDPRAAEPTKGFPWAFPDSMPSDDRRGSRSSESSGEHDGISRQNSYAASINSSIFTTESMPVGQKRFEDDLQHHHHSLQHRSVTSLQAHDPGSPQTPGGSGNYSRTPELRVSHKMAERKRRSEMKSLFDELNNILPNSPGGKSSKWEILTKAIEHIKGLKYSGDAIRRETDRMRNDIEMSRRLDDENRMLRSEVQAMFQQLSRLDPSSAHVYGNLTNQLQHEQPPAPVAPASMLPPLQNNGHTGQWAQAAPAAMQGVEYAPGQGYDHR